MPKDKDLVKALHPTHIANPPYLLRCVSLCYHPSEDPRAGYAHTRTHTQTHRHTPASMKGFAAPLSWLVCMYVCVCVTHAALAPHPPQPASPGRCRRRPRRGRCRRTVRWRIPRRGRCARHPPTISPSKATCCDSTSCASRQTGGRCMHAGRLYSLSTAS